MKELVEFIAKSLVDHPDQVVVVEVKGRSGVELQLSVADSDMGRVIGRRGRVAKAIRGIGGAAGEEEGLDVQVEFLD